CILHRPRDGPRHLLHQLTHGGILSGRCRRGEGPLSVSQCCQRARRSRLECSAKTTASTPPAKPHSQHGGGRSRRRSQRGAPALPSECMRRSHSPATAAQGRRSWAGCPILRVMLLISADGEVSATDGHRPVILPLVPFLH